MGPLVEQEDPKQTDKGETEKKRQTEGRIHRDLST